MNKYYPDAFFPVTIDQFLLQHAVKRADFPAIIHKNTIWTYAELKRQALSYSQLLLNAGLSVGDRVILRSEPCPEAIALFIACSMNGHVFVPLSMEFPISRVIDIVNSTEAKAYIRTNDDSIPSFSGIYGKIDQGGLSLGGGTLDKTDGKLLESDPAYIIFTSGSTGEPKGIVMSHRAALVCFRALVSHCDMGPSERLATISPISFDFSILDMATALGSGATLVQMQKSLLHQPSRFIEYLKSNDVTAFHGVPSIWKILLSKAKPEIAKLSNLKSILFAGERFPLHLIKELRQLHSGLRIINCFGHSESICCSLTDVPSQIPSHWNDLPITNSYPGAEMILVNTKGEILKGPGEGELFLRAASLFSGYWKDIAGTSQKLIESPFQTGDKIFKTGDLLVRDENKDLFFKGRVDFQVKVQGNRVELEEIERIIKLFPGVKDAGVISFEEQSRIRLIALIESSNEISLPNINQHCLNFLPTYMALSEAIKVKDIPYTDVGKLDRRELLDIFLKKRGTNEISFKKTS